MPEEISSGTFSAAGQGNERDGMNCGQNKTLPTEVRRASCVQALFAVDTVKKSFLIFYQRERQVLKINRIFRRYPMI